ncbi:MAG: hypothetical protein Q8O74_00425, partial [bacterium]|nr:hypothetical protein [bacterium]
KYEGILLIRKPCLRYSYGGQAGNQEYLSRLWTPKNLSNEGNMAIIISQDGKNAQKVDKSEFDKEGYLQKYIHENPESIPVYEIEEDKNLFVVAREFPTESGPIDALAIDKDGDIYVVETKLYKNPDKRTVVAQALDYGASLWRHGDYNEFMSKINNEISNKFKISFEEKIKEFFNIDDEQIVLMLNAINVNLKRGNIKFVVLMDAIDDRLKDLIVYINQNSQFDIYAVQMEYYKFEKYEIMIPKLFGAEVKKEIRVSTSVGVRNKWDEERFFEVVNNNLKKSDAEAIKILYEYSKGKADQISWGTGADRGSFNPKFLKISVRAPYSVFSDGTVQINFLRLNDSEVTEKYSDDFKKELEKFEGAEIPINYKNSYGYIPIEKLGPKVNDFIKIVDGLLR